MNLSQKKKITHNLIDTFYYAGKIAIDLRKKGLKTEIKKDNTPVSNGDIEVNKILTNKILTLTPQIPIISEETTDNKNDTQLNNFWLIDPIDGTNDYINNRDEFTLNAALILNKKPEIGLIYAPAKNRMFYSYGKNNSFEKINNNEINLFQKKRENLKEIIAVSYSDKLKPEILEIHNKFKVKKFKKMKSSYKFCVIASGEYDFYAAEPRACEWDIAAGHAIVDHSGGSISDFNGDEIRYAKKDFKNPSIIVRGRSI